MIVDEVSNDTESCGELLGSVEFRVDHLQCTKRDFMFVECETSAGMSISFESLCCESVSIVHTSTRLTLNHRIAWSPL